MMMKCLLKGRQKSISTFTEFTILLQYNLWRQIAGATVWNQSYTRLLLKKEFLVIETQINKYIAFICPNLLSNWLDIQPTHSDLPKTQSSSQSHHYQLSIILFLLWEATESTWFMQSRGLRKTYFLILDPKVSWGPHGLTVMQAALDTKSD